MAEFTEYKPGTFCWVDLSTPDAEAAKRFYTELFGWRIVEMPIPDGSTYTMFQVRGKDVAALYPMGKEQQAAGVPPHWMSYVSVTSADDTAEKAASLGAEILAGPFDVMESGRMVMFQDPTGAQVAAWQPKDHFGAVLANEPGAFCWNELATKDVKKATDFYTQLFDWQVESQEMPGGFVYSSFLNDGRYNGGMMQMSEEWGDMPSNWTVYFTVESCDESVERVQSLGGSVMVPPTDIPNIGRFSMLQDPQGAIFAMLEFPEVA
ncbi:MAG: VOC family protein [Anaerolineae bacterium]|nr:VOC family protein [Anaerolineae bacterium]